MCKKMSISCADGKNAGFSLVELAVVLVVVGVIMGGASAMIGPYIESVRYKTTQQKMERIADELAEFAQTYYTLPCAAEADSVPNYHGLPPGTTIHPSNGFAHRECGSSGRRGIVPYRVLGLTEDDVKDAYGNYFTYIVSEVLDQYKDNIGIESHNSFDVNYRCMRPEWKEVNRIWNKMKAKFCCPSRKGMGGSAVTNQAAFEGRILQVFDGSAGGGLPTPTVVSPTFFGACNDDEYSWSSAPVTDIKSACFSDAGFKGAGSETVMFALISHGRGGYGAYLPGGGQVTAVGLPAVVQETDNMNSSSRVVSRPLSLVRDASYYDDIVLWRTNYQLMSAFGGNSCAYP